MVYNDTTSDAKAKKHHINKIAEKVSSSGGANKPRAWLVSASDAVADSNEDTISNSNVNMDVAAEIEVGGVDDGTGTGT